MKNYFLLFCFFTLQTLVAQPTRIVFSYDDAGNQKKREICINCLYSKTQIDSVRTAETITENDLIKEDSQKNISYYPNPVREELYVKWTKDQGNIVKGIEVYSMNGQLMKKDTDLQKTEIATIGFQSYPQGFYNVILVFDNGEKKTLKIIKQ